MSEHSRNMMLLGFAVLSFVGCTTTKNVVAVDYSTERSVRYEIEAARAILAKDSVAALARAWAIRDNAGDSAEVDALYSESSEKVRQEFKADVDSGRWANATSLYKSLSALSLRTEGWDAESLAVALRKSWVDQGNRTLAEMSSVQASTPADEAPSSGIVSSMIKGTVTVWVDRGLRVENGIGYADRVIGSGFFIDDRGYFVTNYHVIQSEVDPKYEGYSRLFIKLPSDTDSRIPAKVIGWDPVLDLALVKTEVTPAAVFQLGSSQDLKVGTRIYAIGSPAGLEQTLTSGIVSAKNRRLLSLGDVLQIDAPINHGNSGGPIVDEAGRVQAVVFAGIESYEGLNFAIPIELLRVILPSLYAGGEVTHPWLGAWGKSATLSGSSENAGVTVVYALPGSPCQIAGISEGSVITAINGAPVKTLEELQSAIIRESPRTIVKLTGFRMGEDGKMGSPRDWFVMLDSRPENPSKDILDRDLESRAMLPLFGLNLEKVGSSKKFTVSSIIRGAIADESGFSTQDVVEIRDVKVDDDNGLVTVQLMTKKRKAGYMDAYISLTASLDSPSYF